MEMSDVVRAFHVYCEQNNLNPAEYTIAFIGQHEMARWKLESTVKGTTQGGQYVLGPRVVISGTEIRFGCPKPLVIF